MPAANASQPGRLHDPVTGRMQAGFVRLMIDQTVGQALAAVRQNPPPERIYYFYVCDADGRLRGVVPTRRLMLGDAQQPLAEIMIRDVVTISTDATIRQACELFLKHSFLALPVIDANGRMLGTVNVDQFAQEMAQFGAPGPVRRLLEPITRFMQIESASGLVLLACAIIAMILANSPWSQAYAAFWHKPVGITIGQWSFVMSLDHWINDGLMTLFFFVIGLEIKWEFLYGELNDRFKATLPIVAAIGGMIAPAIVYLAIAPAVASRGWAVPTATDIAFAVGFLTLLGSRVPRSLKVLLLALAIVDDIGATLIIALVYSHDLNASAMLAACAGLGVMVACRLAGIRRVGVYWLLAVPIWFAWLKSGIHPTVAGVLVGLLTPATPWLGDRVPVDLVKDLFRRLSGPLDEGRHTSSVELASPLERLQHGLHPWVAFGIMPLFALANAGVAFNWQGFAEPVKVAVAAGLVFGKPLGITIASWLAVRAGLARFPQGVSQLAYLGIGCLAGIGFTMSIFIARLALPEHLDQAKLGIMAGSVVSALLGVGLLWCFLPREKATP